MRWPVLRLLNWTLDLILKHPLIFWACMAANAVGVAWGGWIWYGPLLAASPAWAWPFIPDCPEAALWASIALIGIYYGRRSSWFTAFAAFGCIKYGIWTLLFWLRHWSVAGAIEPLEAMLFISHIGLTCEGVLLALRIGPLGLPARLGIIGWYALSIVVDYRLGYHPPLTYAVPMEFVLWAAIGLTALLGLGLLLSPAQRVSLAPTRPAASQRGL